MLHLAAVTNPIHMTSLLGQPVFRIADETCHWEDVLIAAGMWGHWDAADRETREGIACVAEADRVGPPTGFEDEVRQAAADFRYARNLVAADEAQAWLRQWTLTAEQWMRFIRRSALRRLWGTRLSDIVRDHASREDAIDDEIVTTLICADYLSRTARKLASRIALRERLATERVPTSPLREGRADTASTPENGWLPHSFSAGLLSGVPPDRVRESINRVKQVDAAVEELQRRLRASPLIDQEVDAHQIDWVQVEVQTVRVSSAEAAREAALCLREDGLDVADVASSASVQVESARYYLDDVEGALRDQFLAARPGDVIGPIADNGTFVIYRIDAKQLPSPNDSNIRQKAEHAALQRTLARELNDRVRWLVPV